MHQNMYEGHWFVPLNVHVSSNHSEAHRREDKSYRSNRGHPRSGKRSPWQLCAQCGCEHSQWLAWFVCVCACDFDLFARVYVRVRMTLIYARACVCMCMWLWFMRMCVWLVSALSSVCMERTVWFTVATFGRVPIPSFCHLRPTANNGTIRHTRRAAGILCVQCVWCACVCVRV